MVVVGLGWFVCAAFGALPYILCEPSLGPAAAFFESVSGFTTTGSSVIRDLDALPRSILLWRSLTQSPFPHRPPNPRPAADPLPPPGHGMPGHPPYPVPRAVTGECQRLTTKARGRRSNASIILGMASQHWDWRVYLSTVRRGGHWPVRQSLPPITITSSPNTTAAGHTGSSIRLGSWRQLRLPGSYSCTARETPSGAFPQKRAVCLATPLHQPSQLVGACQVGKASAAPPRCTLQWKTILDFQQGRPQQKVGHPRHTQ